MYRIDFRSISDRTVPVAAEDLARERPRQQIGGKR
jgi:hypothetical protein